MKVVLVLLAVVSVALALTCPGYTCISSSNPLTATCGLVNGSQSYHCPSGYFCNIPDNTTTEGKCALLLATGTVGCILGANDCNLNAECVLGRSGQAYRSVLTNLNTTVCQAYSYIGTSGQPCNDVTGCMGTLTCEYGLCAPKPSVGQNCDGMDCAGSSFCNANDVCTAMFSTHVGGICMETTDCLAGDYCNMATPGSNGTCATSGAATNAVCQSEADCAAYETCECAWTASAAATGRCVAPQVYTQAQAATITAVYDCTYAHNCGGPATALSTAQGCTACKSQYCAYFNQTLEAEASVSSSSYSCLATLLDPVAIHTYCTKTSSASSVAASLAFLFMGLLVAL